MNEDIILRIMFTDIITADIGKLVFCRNNIDKTKIPDKKSDIITILFFLLVKSDIAPPIKFNRIDMINSDD